MKTRRQVWTFLVQQVSGMEECPSFKTSDVFSAGQDSLLRKLFNLHLISTNYQVILPIVINNQLQHFRDSIENLSIISAGKFSHASPVLTNFFYLRLQAAPDPAV